MTPFVIEERQMNVTAMDIYSRLLMDRIIFLSTEITSEVSSIIQAQLLFLQAQDDKKPITIYINSPGGEVIAGLGIIDTMKLIKPKVNTVCTGMAASMAAVILSVGAERSALPNSSIMFHDLSGWAGGNIRDVEIELEFMKSLKERTMVIIEKSTDLGDLEVALNRDLWLTSKQALDKKVIDKIL